MSSAPTPLFIFALPRSGSTLLQRILGADAAISTVTEPHLLLPFLYALRKKGVYAEYRHQEMAVALEDFCKELPNGVEDYFAEVRRLTLALYTQSVPKPTRYFLDKTPHYHTIAEDILRVFPEGKFLFLWRHPLAVVASCIETWGGGKWNLHRHKFDHFVGLENLLHAHQTFGDRACTLRYEDLLSDPEREMQRVMAYLDLPFDSSVLSRFVEVELKGRITDPTGAHQYKTVSQEPLDKWKRTLSNPLRKLWAKRYLRWIGAERLGLMGYDLAELLQEVQSTPTSLRFFGSDLRLAPLGVFQTLVDIDMVMDKIGARRHWHRINLHS